MFIISAEKFKRIHSFDYSSRFCKLLKCLNRKINQWVNIYFFLFYFYYRNKCSSSLSGLFSCQWLFKIGISVINFYCSVRFFPVQFHFSFFDWQLVHVEPNQIWYRNFTTIFSITPLKPYNHYNHVAVKFMILVSFIVERTFNAIYSINHVRIYECLLNWETYIEQHKIKIKQNDHVLMLEHTCCCCCFFLISKCKNNYEKKTPPECQRQQCDDKIGNRDGGSLSTMRHLKVI